MVIYILTKFGDDWLIFVDARVLTSKLRTDGRTYARRRTVHDQNSLLSTPCSGELKKKMLSTRIFFYSHKVFYPVEELGFICYYLIFSSTWTSLEFAEPL